MVEITPLTYLMSHSIQNEVSRKFIARYVNGLSHAIQTNLISFSIPLRIEEKLFWKQQTMKRTLGYGRELYKEKQVEEGESSYNVLDQPMMLIEYKVDWLEVKVEEAILKVFVSDVECKAIWLLNAQKL